MIYPNFVGFFELFKILNTETLVLQIYYNSKIRFLEIWLVTQAEIADGTKKRVLAQYWQNKIADGIEIQYWNSTGCFYKPVLCQYWLDMPCQYSNKIYKVISHILISIKYGLHAIYPYPLSPISEDKNCQVSINE